MSLASGLWGRQRARQFLAAVPQYSGGVLFVVLLTAWQVATVPTHGESSRVAQAAWSLFWVSFWFLGGHGIVELCYRALGRPRRFSWMPSVCGVVVLTVSGCCAAGRAAPEIVAGVAWTAWLAGAHVELARLVPCVWRRRDYGGWFCVLLIGGLILRLHMLVAVPLPFLEGDTLTYTWASFSLFERLEMVFLGERTPSYIIFVWGVFRGIAPNYLVVVVIQHLLGVVGAVLLYRALLSLARGARWVGLFGMCSVLFSRTMLVAEHSVLSDAALAVGAIVVVWLGFRVFQTRRMRGYLGLGLLLAVLFMLRPSAVYLVGACMVASLLVAWPCAKRMAISSILLFVPVVSVAVGWSDLQARHFHGFRGITSMAGWHTFRAFGHLVDFSVPTFVELKDAVRESVSQANSKMCGWDVSRYRMHREWANSHWTDKVDSPEAIARRHFAERGLSVSDRQEALKGLVREGVWSHRWVYLDLVGAVLGKIGWNATSNATYRVRIGWRIGFLSPQEMMRKWDFVGYRYEVCKPWIAASRWLDRFLPRFDTVFSILPPTRYRGVWLAGTLVFLVLSLARWPLLSDGPARLLIVGAGLGYVGLIAATALPWDRYLCAVDPMIVGCTALAGREIVTCHRRRRLVIALVLVSVVSAPIGLAAWRLLPLPDGPVPVGMAMERYRTLVSQGTRFFWLSAAWFAGATLFVLWARWRQRDRYVVGQAS